MMPFQIAIYPHGVIGNEFRSVDAAVQLAQQLERVGHTITSINCGNEIYATGKALRDLLGEKEVDTFKNFGRTRADQMVVSAACQRNRPKVSSGCT
jgi:ribulose-5-phosphate 4-epimerase/fuculose-1-phosphate aldolase